MMDSANVPEVEVNEELARYVLYRRHIRSSNQTVRPDAFIPHPHLELSVTRHRDATEAEVWQIGEQVASQQRKTLHGRADVAVKAFQSQGLDVVKAPVTGNPNHANVCGWPADKPRQKMIAIEVAASSTFRLPPTKNP